jgi:hypothetical protein
MGKNAEGVFCGDKKLIVAMWVMLAWFVNIGNKEKDTYKDRFGI